MEEDTGGADIFRPPVPVHFQIVIDLSGPSREETALSNIADSCERLRVLQRKGVTTLV
ncbi:MAG: hypothetical protein ACLQJ7_19815 [Syntrophobacteraceae bacterium]